jgi:hypothetical protein
MTRIFTLLLLIFGLNAVTAQDFYDINKIHEVRIKFKSDNYDAILHQMKERDKGERLVADVTFNGVTVKDCGVRYKGNSSYHNTRKYEKSKLPFNIKADFVTEGQEFAPGISKLKLSNVFRDPSYLREVMSYQIANKYMPSPKANFVKVYANDKYLGLYNNTESVEDDFLKEHYDTKKGTLIKCDPSWNQEESPDCPKGDKASLQYLGDKPECYTSLYEMKSGGDEAWKQLIELTKILNEKPEDIEKYLNVDQALWMFAFNNVLVNLDSYTGRLCHNYYLYKNPKSGLFEPIVWDMNLSFGGFRFAADKGLSNEDMATMSPFIHYKTRNPKRPLLVKLLENDLYRKVYVGHMRTILEENFYNGEYKKQAEKIRQRIDSSVREDSNKLYPYEEYQKNYTQTAQAGRSKIVGITELMEARITYLKAHPLLAKAPPTIEKPTTEKYSETDLVVQAKVMEADKVHVMYRATSDAAFARMEMFDDGGHNDQTGDDKIYGATIPYAKGTEYYVIAEGSRSAALSPARASYEFYTVE